LVRDRAQVVGRRTTGQERQQGEDEERSPVGGGGFGHRRLVVRRLTLAGSAPSGRMMGVRRRPGQNLPAMTSSCPAPARSGYDLERFVRDVEAILDRHPSVPATIKEVSVLVGRLVRDTSWLPPEYRKPITDSYARYLLHRDRTNRFVVLSLVW